MQPWQCTLGPPTTGESLTRGPGCHSSISMLDMQQSHVSRVLFHTRTEYVGTLRQLSSWETRPPRNGPLLEDSPVALLIWLRLHSSLGCFPPTVSPSLLCLVSETCLAVSSPSLPWWTPCFFHAGISPHSLFLYGYSGLEGSWWIQCRTVLPQQITPQTNSVLTIIFMQNEEIIVRLNKWSLVQDVNALKIWRDILKFIRCFAYGILYIPGHNLTV